MSSSPLKEEVTMLDTATTAAGPAPAGLSAAPPPPTVPHGQHGKQ
jgi:hypothetical protein